MKKTSTRQVRYQEIADDLRTRVGGGEYAAGSRLPSESELSAAYSASRVTVRRALDSLRAERLIDARQGFGWFVAAEPLRQELHQLGTIDSQLRAAGIVGTRRILSFGFVKPPARVSEILGPQLAGRQVLEVGRVNLADGQPFALVTVWCPEELGADLSRADVERASFLEQLPVELGGASQTIGAAAADAVEAQLLDVPVGAPVLVVERITRDTVGRPVLVSRHVFAAHRTEFAVELPAASDGLAPTGLRLVE